jgi:transketolase
MVTTMRERFAATAIDLVDEAERAVVVLAEIGVDSFEDALRAYPDRVVNIGIMEQALVGVAAGMAMEGFHPLVHTIAAFLVERPFEQLKVDFGYQGLSGTFVSVGGSYDYSTSGCTHHAPGDVQALRGIPRMRVLVPGHADEVDRLMRGTFGDDDPTYIRTSTTQNRSSFDVEPGRLAVIRRGTRASVIAVGPLLSRTLDATEDLDVSVLYATTVEPFDVETLRSVVNDGSTVAIVEPYYEGTTLGAMRAGIDDRTARVVSIGVPRRFLHEYGTPQEHDAALGLDGVGIRRRLSAVLAS